MYAPKYAFTQLRDDESDTSDADDSDDNMHIITPKKDKDDDDDVLHTLPPPPPPPPAATLPPSTSGPHVSSAFGETVVVVQTKQKRTIEKAYDIDDDAKLPLAMGCQSALTQHQKKEAGVDLALIMMMSAVQVCDDGMASDFSLQANLDYRAKRDQKILDTREPHNGRRK